MTAGVTSALGLLSLDPLLSFAKLGLRSELSYFGMDQSIRWQEMHCLQHLPGSPLETLRSP